MEPEPCARARSYCHSSRKMIPQSHTPLPNCSRPLNLPLARVIRLPNASHFFFRSNETEVLRERKHSSTTCRTPQVRPTNLGPGSSLICLGLQMAREPARGIVGPVCESHHGSEIVRRRNAHEIESRN